MNNLNHYFPAARGLKLCQYPPLLPSPSSPIRGPGVTASRPLPSGPPPPSIPTSQPASQFPDTPLRYTHWAPPRLRAPPLQTPGTLGLPHPTLPFQHPYPPGRRQRRSTWAAERRSALRGGWRARAGWPGSRAPRRAPAAPAPWPVKSAKRPGLAAARPPTGPAPAPKGTKPLPPRPRTPRPAGHWATWCTGRWDLRGQEYREEGERELSSVSEDTDSGGRGWQSWNQTGFLTYKGGIAVLISSGLCRELNEIKYKSHSVCPAKVTWVFAK